ncbi:MAG: nuclear transport factor 2 family protein [Chloroflexi bacterium]|nr:nuclear transport factor 2 family protein [Chloroflexota bacterium]
MDDRALILETNRNFYRAMAASDMRLMDEVWLHAEFVGCVHPGWSQLSGWKAVRESWVEIFADGQPMQIMPSQVVIHCDHDTAWVTCVENITTHGEDAWQYSIAQATNVFQRVNDGWKLVHHHASAMPPPEAQGWHNEEISSN